jgi:hypothetical protein
MINAPVGLPYTSQQLMALLQRAQRGDAHAIALLRSILAQAKATAAANTQPGAASPYANSPANTPAGTGPQMLSTPQNAGQILSSMMFGPQANYYRTPEIVAPEVPLKQIPAEDDPNTVRGNAPNQGGLIGVLARLLGLQGV